MLIKEPPAPPLTSLARHPTPTLIPLGNDVIIGGKSLILMAGPCAIESEEQLITTGLALREHGVEVLRASAFKPRTSPYSFQGLGKEGLEMHRRAKLIHGLLIESEVMDPRDVEKSAEILDVLRVGARNMSNFDLLKELGGCRKPVILKRGIAATVDEWLLAAEYLLYHGNPRVILCERGIRTFETATRYTLDLSSVPVLKSRTHLPVIVDPSHAAGKASLVPALARAAVAVGCHGLLIEVHCNPASSTCDAEQALSTAAFGELAKSIELISGVLA